MNLDDFGEHDGGAEGRLMSQLRLLHTSVAAYALKFQFGSLALILSISLSYSPLLLTDLYFAVIL